MAITVYTYNDKVLKNVATDKWLKKYDPYNPLGLPDNTMRIKMKSGSSAPSITDATVTAVQGQADVYDVYYNSSNWSQLFLNNSNLLEVLGANTTMVTNMSGLFKLCNSLRTIALFDTSNVTNMREIFNNCKALTTIPLFNTSKVTDMSSMFFRDNALTSVPLLDTSSVTDMTAMFIACTALTTVPLFNTSNVTVMTQMLYDCTALTSIPLFNTVKVRNLPSAFYGCTNVQSGALALYQQASTQANPPTGYSNAFTNCGSNTVTGAAELAQIPTSWGGTAS